MYGIFICWVDIFLIGLMNTIRLFEKNERIWLLLPSETLFFRIRTISSTSFVTTCNTLYIFLYVSVLHLVHPYVQYICVCVFMCVCSLGYYTILPSVSSLAILRGQFTSVAQSCQTTNKKPTAQPQKKWNSNCVCNIEQMYREYSANWTTHCVCVMILCRITGYAPKSIRKWTVQHDKLRSERLSNLRNICQ